MACKGREWLPPPAASSASLLQLYNSLVDEKVPFVPAAGAHSRQISWYACGPTVYDSAHMGHARNYVTFDVIRRVLEDYFGYNVLYVMNVTDVDDKIILRARRNHLLAQYRQQATDPQQVAVAASEAVSAALAKQEKKQAAIAAQAAAAADARQRQDLEAALKQEQHKHKQWSDMQHDLQQLVAGGHAADNSSATTTTSSSSSSSSPPSIDDVMAVAGDALMEWLDSQHGSGVSDPTIFRAHAEKYEREFFEDMAALGVRRPDVLTRVVEYLPEIVAYVQRIIDNGMAYESNGSVYFDTARFRAEGHVYGKCKPSSVGVATLASESEANFETQEKRSSQDFALWKAAKPGEPAWDSPWGRGRPGWHIECSAMASSIIGAKLDVHSGGEDLKFPHHDNELAQAEAFYHHEGCRQWVNYFLHSGHLEIEGLKMSKSLKNFITIREALQHFSARQLRLMFVMQPWGKPMCYGESARAEMRARESMLKNFFQNVDAAVRQVDLCSSSGKWQAEELELNQAILEGQAKVHECLLDNINTAGALDALAAIVKATNLYLSSKEQQRQQQQQQQQGQHAAPAAAAAAAADQGEGSLQGGLVSPLLLDKAAAYVTRILSVMGLVQAPSDKPGFGAEGGGGGRDDAAAAGYLDAFSSFRDTVRALSKAKAGHGELLAACDDVRDHTLPLLGVRLEDRPDGKAVWKLDDPAALAAERAERLAAAAAAERKKLCGALAVKEKELDKFAKLAALPSVREALRDKYGAWDEGSGEPTHDKEGQALDGKALDKARKEVDKAQKVREPLAKRLAEDPGFLGALQEEVARLRQQLAGLDASG